MLIGVTERGDPAFDTSWIQRLSSVDGAIIITKHITDAIRNVLLTSSTPCILHCTCTGWGGSWMEPNVPNPRVQLGALKELFNSGFPPERVVLRIDPIIPIEEGLRRASGVLDYCADHDINISRVRISVYDNYPHARERILRSSGMAIYGGSFQAPYESKMSVIEALERYPYTFETCAEDILSTTSSKFIVRGCVSSVDIRTLGLSTGDMSAYENGQGRAGCHCLTCKKELLNTKRRCPHGCLYCYWKD